MAVLQSFDPAMRDRANLGVRAHSRMAMRRKRLFQNLKELRLR
jgi:hypothetical protein